MNIRTFFLTFLVLIPQCGVLQPNALTSWVTSRGKEMAIEMAQATIEHKSITLLGLLAQRALARLPQPSGQPITKGTQKALAIADKRHTIYSRFGIKPALVTFLEQTAHTFVRFLLIDTLVNTARARLFGTRTRTGLYWPTELMYAAVGGINAMRYEIEKQESTPVGQIPRTRSIQERSCTLHNSLCSFAALILIRACLQEGVSRGGPALTRAIQTLRSR